MARSTKLTPEIQAQICGYLRKCLTLEDAATLVGITRQTIHNWVKRGELAKRGKHREFFYAIHSALNYAKVEMIAEVRAYSRGEKPTRWKEQVRKPGKDGAVMVMERVFEPARYTEVLLKSRYPEEFAALKQAQDELPAETTPQKIIIEVVDPAKSEEADRARALMRAEEAPMLNDGKDRESENTH